MAHGGGAAAQDAAESRALAQFGQELLGPGGVAEIQESTFHGHGHGAAHLDGVHPEVVAHAVNAGDGVQVVDAAVGSPGPDRLVLGPLADVLAPGVVEDA
jgi:hypothetical protein